MIYATDRKYLLYISFGMHSVQNLWYQLIMSYTFILKQSRPTLIGSMFCLTKQVQELQNIHRHLT